MCQQYENSNHVPIRNERVAERSMDDLKFGTRDKRGNWFPNEPLEIASF